MNTEKLKKEIVQIARAAHNHHWRATSSQPVGNTQAKIVTETWQKNVLSINPSRFQTEVPVGGNIHERMDLIDNSNRIAYEFKVSGKNPKHEFYKDIFKVFAYNFNNPNNKLQKLVFITEPAGIKSLQNSGLVSSVLAMSSDFNIQIELKSI